jgi:hypothetical protein
VLRPGPPFLDLPDRTGRAAQALFGWGHGRGGGKMDTVEVEQDGDGDEQDSGGVTRGPGGRARSGNGVA